MSLKTQMKIKKCKKTTLITAQCGRDLDLSEKEIWERDKESKVIPKMKQPLEIQELLRYKTHTFQGNVVILAN